jgi:hypothetical protein
MGAQMHTDAAVNRNAPASHAAPDPFHLPKISVNVEIFTTLALHIEEVIQAATALAEVDGAGADLVVVLSTSA